MFQSVSELDSKQEVVNNKIIYRLKEIFRIQNIVIYILSFLISMLSIKGKLMPFGLSIIAACIGENIPIIGVFISSMIGTFCGNGLKCLGNTLIIFAVYLFFVLFIKSKVAIEERNEEIKSGGKLFAACFIVSIVQNFINGFLLFDIFMGAINACLVYVFYKIFVNGLAVIRDFNIKQAFSTEELIAGILIIALASLAFNNISIFSLKITNVIIIFLIMVLGWKGGMSVGALAGVSTGLATCFVSGTSLIQVSMFAISGVIAGALNRFGKIGVIIGFILGNSILTYITNGNAATIIYFREIFIASIGLLFVPSNIKVNLEEVFEKNRYLRNGGDNRLEEAKESEVSKRLKTLSEMFNSYIGQTSNLDSVNIEQDFLDNIEEVKENIFYDEIANEEVGISKDICDVLLKNDILLDNDLVEILKKHNNYVVLQDDNIKNDLREIVKIANRTLKMFQMNKIKSEERKKNFEAINEELSTVTKVIDRCAEDIMKKSEDDFSKKCEEIELLLKAKNINNYNCSIKKLENEKLIVEVKLDYYDTRVREKNTITGIGEIISKALKNKIVFQRERLDDDKKEYSQVYSSEDKFVLQVGSAKITKDGSSVSGDCSLQIKLADGKYLLAIADGMGTGEKAREYSKLTLRLIKQLLSAGFNKEESIKLINTRLNLLEEAEKYSSLDVSILDLFAGKIDLLKNGACSTYIKNKKAIQEIKSEAVPLGIINNAEVRTKTIDIEDGEIIVMCSDGIVDSKSNDFNWMEKFLKNISTNNVQKMADLILAEAIDNNYGVAQDDMTVIVSKIVKRK